MRPLRLLSLGCLLIASTLAACAGSPVVEDDPEGTVTPEGGPGASASSTSTAKPPPPPSDAGTDTARPTDASPPTDSAVVPDSATVPDSAVVVDSAVPPPVDSGTGGPATCASGDFFVEARALSQIAAGRFPACNAACTTCCYRGFLTPFCLEPL